MKSTIGVFVLLLIILSATPAFSEMPFLEIDGNGECSYLGYNYDVYYATVDSLGRPRHYNIYHGGDSVPSKYESESIRATLSETIYNYYGNKLPKDSVCPFLLLAEYEFPESPDFVLLKYRIGPDLAFIALVKSTGELYYLTDYLGYSIIDSYNALVKENPNILNLSLQCLAKLILKLKYPAHELTFPSSIYDIKIAIMTIGVQNLQIPIIFYAQNAQELYFEGLSNNERSTRLYEMKTISESMIKQTVEYSVDTFFSTHNITFTEDIIDRDDEYKEVILTTYEPYSGEISRWRLLFTRENRMTGTMIIDGPYECFRCEKRVSMKIND